MTNNKLFVGNLAYGTNDADLRKHFEAVGDVASARVITDRNTGTSRGFGFVEMDSIALASEAREKLDGSALSGRNIHVNPADNKGAGGRHERR